MKRSERVNVSLTRILSQKAEDESVEILYQLERLKITVRHVEQRRASAREENPFVQADLAAALDLFDAHRLFKIARLANEIAAMLPVPGGIR